jgi:predicted TIM-barrel fold metal-dependent hydrolase
MSEVPHSTGTAPPRSAAPAHACDAHIHIYDTRLASGGMAMSNLANATVTDYRKLQKRLGTSRVVVVQPRTHGTDNTVTIDAVAKLGLARARGIAVMRTDVSDATLKQMDKAGIRGLRFSVHEPHLSVTSIDMIEPLSKRVHDLGWHVQLHMTGDQIVENAKMIGRLPSAIVIDHMGRFPQPQGPKHPAFAVLLRLLDRGDTWVKIAGAYLDSQTGGPDFSDVAQSARALIAAAPQRLVWGTDWPHPTERVMPDDAQFFDRLADWTPNEATRVRILVDNPAQLYGFPTTPG